MWAAKICDLFHMTLAITFSGHIACHTFSLNPIMLQGFITIDVIMIDMMQLLAALVKLGWKADEWGLDAGPRSLQGQGPRVKYEGTEAEARAT